MYSITSRGQSPSWWLPQGQTWCGRTRLKMRKQNDHSLRSRSNSPVIITESIQTWYISHVSFVLWTQKTVSLTPVWRIKRSDPRATRSYDRRPRNLQRSHDMKAGSHTDHTYACGIVSWLFESVPLTYTYFFHIETNILPFFGNRSKSEKQESGVRSVCYFHETRCNYYIYFCRLSPSTQYNIIASHSNMNINIACSISRDSLDLIYNYSPQSRMGIAC